MPIVVFRGTVRPLIHNLSIHRTPKVRYRWPDQSLTVDFVVKVIKDVVEVECDATRFDKAEHLSMLAMHAYHLSTAAVDSVCFHTGMGLTVFLESFVDIDGNESNLAPHADDIRGLCKAFDLSPSYEGGNNFQAMYGLLVQDRLLMLALNDLIVPISRFDLAAINCARAIEALRNSMAPGGTSRESGWTLMQENLNFTKDYLTFVTSLSTGPRHGDRRAPEVGQQAEILRRSWIIMDRFLEFRKRGSLPLPITEFDLL
jgi:hypothetical protein